MQGINEYWKAKDAQVSGPSDGVVDGAIHRDQEHTKREGKRQTRANLLLENIR